MRIDKHNLESDFFNEVINGIKRASKKMAEQSAARNEELIVADKNGKPLSVPAKELLKKLEP